MFQLIRFRLSRVNTEAPGRPGCQRPRPIVCVFLAISIALLAFVSGVASATPEGAQQFGFVDSTGSLARNRTEYYVRVRLFLEGVSPASVALYGGLSGILGAVASALDSGGGGSLEYSGVAAQRTWFVIETGNRVQHVCRAVIARRASGTPSSLPIGFVLVRLEGDTCHLPGTGFDRLVHEAP